MKKITPFKRIDKYTTKKERFDTLKNAEKYIRKNGTSDYIVIDNVLYSMSEYDMSGKTIEYHNMRTGNSVFVETSNRYDKNIKFSDAVLSIIENFGVSRNDVFYTD